MSKNTITIDTLVEDLNLPKWDELEELNLDYIGGVYYHTEQEAIKEGLPEEEAEEAAEQAEHEAQRELFSQWHGAVMKAAERLFEEHHLNLEGTEGDEFPWQFAVVPAESWEKAADEIRETINGYGMFHFNDLEEFLSSGPYTAEEAVMGHLHWIKWWPEIYGADSARTIYDRQMR